MCVERMSGTITLLKNEVCVLMIELSYITNKEFCNLVTCSCQCFLQILNKQKYCSKHQNTEFAIKRRLLVIL